MYFCVSLTAKEFTTMKKATTKPIADGRKVYMTLMGMCYSPEQAQQLYGDALESATLAKAILNKDGDVIGSWE